MNNKSDTQYDAKILIVDDEAHNLKLLARILKHGNYEIYQASNGKEALEAVRSYKPDIILLDIIMPEMNGFEVTKRLKEDKLTKHIPIIILTALEDQDSRTQGLAIGAEEFISKPINANEILMRVRNLLRLKQASDIIKDHNRVLEKEVQQRTEQLESAFVETIFTLMRASEYRDDETGAHVRRISFYTRSLAETLGMGDEFCKSIHYASPMHDVGKIGIPDHILLKPGSFEPEEWKVMKTHTTIGAQILENCVSPYSVMGKEIALSHHERWDGSGYPQGLKGEDIPLPARIMQICDVYDALRSKRPYKTPFDHKTSIRIILKGDGRTDPKHFDPDVLSAFSKSTSRLKEIYENYADM
ncbi:MAG: two-component system response regulator [Mariprofundaceae bacterium]|nr:two-component system response regulator [Mariprofundaceae bacterium]